MIKRAWIAAAVVLLAARPAAADGVNYADAPLGQVRDEVAAKKAVLVDVREKGEWDRGHLRDAAFVPLSRLMAWERDGITPAERVELEKSLPKGSVVYCHCAAGARALPGGEVLAKLGYKARPLRQGYRTLLQAGFPQAEGK